LFPLLLNAVRAVEEAIPLPGEGKKKLDLVLCSPSELVGHIVGSC
jgi:hypothetical protein